VIRTQGIGTGIAWKPGNRRARKLPREKFTKTWEEKKKNLIKGLKKRRGRYPGRANHVNKNGDEVSGRRARADAGWR